MRRRPPRDSSRPSSAPAILQWDAREASCFGSASEGAWMRAVLKRGALIETRLSRRLDETMLSSLVFPSSIALRPMNAPNGT